jgi:UDP-N-acetylglucosamine 2-epimerase (non-hydrolysing)
LAPALDGILAEARPDMVMAQGDTTSVFCAALAAFYRRIPFAHVEAGLRSGDLAAPFPEEGLRRLTSQITALHFAPTEAARRQLLDEGLRDESIHVVGNTVIDALLATAARTDLPLPGELGAGPFALVTLHRRENFGLPLLRILGGLRQLALDHPELTLVYPVHPNPNVRKPVRTCLGDLANVRLREPMSYPELVAHLKHCHAVYTDSGGLQEEAPALGKPVLVFRDKTERPEAVAAGGVRLVGSDPALFLREATALLEDPAHYADMAQPRFPYGDGHSAERIQAILTRTLA